MDGKAIDKDLLFDVPVTAYRPESLTIDPK